MERLEVQKTYKLYIGGQFPRTESGRYLKLNDSKGNFKANVCFGSRKDLRNAIEKARAAFFSWSQRPAFNKSQIIYRMAEMLESRRDLFIKELESLDSSNKTAEKMIDDAVDLLVYYAGWADKYQQIFSSVNPVSGSYFNFSVYEPTGVVAAMNNTGTSFISFLSSLIPAIIGGNSVVVMVEKELTPLAINFAEVVATSDLPGGVLNIISSETNELLEHASGHMDINALVTFGLGEEEKAKIDNLAANNVKRVFHLNDITLDPYSILDLQEVKTTWHPIENISGGKSGY